MATQQVKENAFGQLQPLVSDLITTTTAPNSFLKPTYTVDSEALKDRLAQYEAYDPSKLGGLVNYVSPYADAVVGGSKPSGFLKESTEPRTYYFKKGELSSLLGGLAGVSPEEYDALKPLLGGLSSVGQMGGKTYFKAPELQQSLSGYSLLSPEEYDKYSSVGGSLLSGVAPVTTLAGKNLYDPDASRRIATASAFSDWLSRNPLAVGGYKSPAEGLTFIQPQTLEELSALNAQLSAPQAPSQYISNWDEFMRDYGNTPVGGWSDSNTKGAGGSFWTRRSYKPPMQSWLDDASYLPKFSLLGSGSPEDIQRGFNLLQRMSPQNINEFWGLAPEVQRGMLENPAAALQQMRAMANPANRDWLSVGAEGGYNNLSAYNWDPQRGLTVDPSRYLQIDDSNNGLLGSFNDFMNMVDPLNGAIENTVGKALGYDNGLDMVRGIGEPIGNLAGSLFSYGIPWSSIVMAADNISTGNDKALLGNVINGVVSYAGANMPTGSVAGTGYSLGSNAANAAANQALMSAASTAVRGGNFSDILKNAAISGLGSYGGGALFGKTDGALKNLSPLAKMAAQTAYGSGVGGLSSMVQGKGFSQGASNAARRGITNAAINAALNSQLYKGLV